LYTAGCIYDYAAKILGTLENYVHLREKKPRR
jgi:hypothetical protein